MKTELFVCITEDNALHSIKWEESKEYFSMSGSEYNELKDSETGEQEARERLEEEDYWKDCSMLPDNLLPVLSRNIDFVKVAEEVISCDGWENINGEYQSFGTIKGKDWFLSLQGCGQHDSWKNTKVKKWLLPESTARKLLILWNDNHLKREERLVKTSFSVLRGVRSRYLALTDRQKVLDLYLEVTK